MLAAAEFGRANLPVLLFALVRATPKGEKMGVSRSRVRDSALLARSER